MIKFSVSRVEKEPVFLEGSESAEFWALPEDDQYTGSSPVEYELTARSVSGSILVSGRVAGKVSAACGRCLVPFELEIVNENIELYYAKEDIREEEMDITADIRDELLITLPMNPLCSDECSGLCPVCGGNRNKKKCSCSQGGNLAWSALDNIVTEDK